MNKINDILANGYTFSIDKFMGDGWRIFKKDAGNYIGYTVVFFIISLFLAGITAFIPGANILTSVVQYVLLAGFFIYARKSQTSRAEFSDFLGGFQYFVQILLFFLVVIAFVLPLILIGVLFILPEGFFSNMISGSNPQAIADNFDFMLAQNGAAFFLYFLAAFIVLMYLYISYSFTLIFIVDRKMRVWDAMEASRKIIGMKFFSFLLLYIVVGIIVTVGTIVTCGLGILIGMPYIYMVTFAAYDNIVGAEDTLEQQIDEFGTGSGE